MGPASDDNWRNAENRNGPVTVESGQKQAIATWVSGGVTLVLGKLGGGTRSVVNVLTDHATLCEACSFSGRHHDSLHLYQSIVWASASGQVLRMGRQPSSLCIFDESMA